MPLMDEFREEREALKHGTFRQRIQYFWDYYKWHTIAVIVGLLCIISFVKNIVDSKDPALSAAMLNCTALMGNSEIFDRAYAEYAGIDLNEYELLFDTDLHISMSDYDQAIVNIAQKLMVTIAAGDLDVMMGGGDTFARYAYNSIFFDIRSILSEEQIARYEPYFYYIDLSVAKEMERLRSELQDPSSVTLPDPRKPEEMEAPVPVALYIDSKKLENYYYFYNTEDGLAIGVLSNTSKMDNVLAFLDYLMQL